tara:strand:- start:613 stop:900 length:288 start_codon:yes stop_codon:yes gene_type:complete
MIKITIHEDRMGSLIFTPVVERYRQQIIEYLKEFDVESDGTALMQSDWDTESFLEECSSRQRRAIKSGWGATILFDTWTFLNYIGWDACEGLELT